MKGGVLEEEPHRDSEKWVGKEGNPVPGCPYEEKSAGGRNAKKKCSVQSKGESSKTLREGRKIWGLTDIYRRSNQEEPKDG